MTYTWEALLKLEYGNPITPSMVEKIHGTGTDYYKIGWNKYILGWELEDEEYKIFYTGFLWVASERILRLDDLDADKVHVTPPEILLPKPGMSSYLELVEYGKKVDPEHFIDVVIRYRMVMFNDFIYCFRDRSLFTIGGVILFLGCIFIHLLKTPLKCGWIIVNIVL